MFRYIICLFFLVGCTPSQYVELPSGNANKTITITEDTTLSQDYDATAFIVRNGATLFAGDFTLDGRNLARTKSFPIVRLYDGSHLVGGNLQYGRSGTVIRHTLPNKWRQVLIGLPQAKRIGYINKIRDGLTGCSTVTDTNYYQNRNSIYVTAITPCAKITNVNIKNGRLGIYHDAYSQHTIVTGSTFDSVGVDYFSTKNTKGVIPYVSARESVAIDGSSHNIYRDNMFIDGKKNAINLYVNCGENEPDGSEGMPREEPSLGNTFVGNTFENYGIAIFNGSRKINRRTYPCRADDQGDRVIGTVVEDNIFINVKTRVKGAL